MRLAELSARSGLSTATIKYYLRSGLLTPGTAQSSTWASYDDSHLRRLRLVRALTDVAGLSLEEVRRVVDAVDASGSDHQARGAAQCPLNGPCEGTLSRFHRTSRGVARPSWVGASHQ
jgi:DNA-binding transcriptional MerR regulator